MDGDVRPEQARPARAGTLGYSAQWSAGDAQPAPMPAPASPRAPQPSRLEPAPKAADPRKDGDEPAAEEKRPMPRWKKALYWLIGLLLLAALIVAGVLYWLHARQFESTDDAFIDGYMSQVSAQVGAKVTKLAFADNQQVKAGQLLIELDPRDFQVRLDQARAQRKQTAAQLDQANAQLGIQRASLDQAQANVRVTEADLTQALADQGRYRAIDPRAVTRQQLDQATATAKAAQARLDANRQAVQGARAQIEAQQAQVEAAEAALAVADVAVANAELQLSYTRVLAPQEGRVTKRTVELGNYVNPGQALLAIVSPDMWVTANFKETQLAHMHPGQPVRIELDACPGQSFDGHVDSFQAGTGAVFSSLPAENATGNYVKVVQRVPVKIVFDQAVQPEQCRLAPGLSVVPRVTVR